MHLNPRTSTKMSKLRFLKFCNSIFEGENKCQVSRFQSARLNGVMYLRWDAYPLKMLPVSIDMEILVSLRLRHSKSEQLGDDAQVYFNIFNACLQTIDANYMF